MSPDPRSLEQTSDSLASPDGFRARIPAVLATLAMVILAGCVMRQPGYEAVQRVDSGASEENVASFNDDLNLLAAQAAAAPGEYQVGPEDLIEVTLYDIEDSSGEPRTITARVSNSGYVTLPYIGKVQATGFSPLELEEELRRHYLRYIHQPQITVFIREYRSFRVSVVGNVQSPGVLELRGRKTLLEALAMAGGLDKEAGRTVRLSRASPETVQSVLIDLDRLAESGDARLNPSLLPGDLINVPRAGIFYVEGMVLKAGAYPLLTPTTVSQALATAGGLRVDLAKTSGTTVYRKTEGGDRVAIPVDLGAIAAGKQQDVPIQPEDVVVVPVSGPKFFVDRVLGLVRVGVNATQF